MTYSRTIRYDATGVRARAACALFLLATAGAFFAVQAISMGLTVNARGASARAEVRAATISSLMIELEGRFAAPQVLTDAEARAHGFSTPTSLSYAAKRPLGRAGHGNEL